MNAAVCAHATHLNIVSHISKYVVQNIYQVDVTSKSKLEQKLACGKGESPRSLVILGPQKARWRSEGVLQNHSYSSVDSVAHPRSSPKEIALKILIPWKKGARDSQPTEANEGKWC